MDYDYQDQYINDRFDGFDSSICFWLKNGNDESYVNEYLLESSFYMILSFFDKNDLDIVLDETVFYEEFVRYAFTYSRHSTSEKTNSRSICNMYKETPSPVVKDNENEDTMLFLDRYETCIGLLLYDIEQLCSFHNVLDIPTRNNNKLKDFIQLIINNIEIPNANVSEGDNGDESEGEVEYDE